MSRRLKEFLVRPLALVLGATMYFGVLVAGVSVVGDLAKRNAMVGAALLAEAVRVEPTASATQSVSASIGHVPVDGTAFEHARPAPRLVEVYDADEIEQMKRDVSERVVLDDPTPWRAADAQRTYKTMCVRLCDGAYFPISFATTRDRFANDEAACRSRCGSPARLFVFPNPGGSPESMQDRSGRSYIALPTAFQFRQGSTEGCSCRAQPWEIASKERHRLYALQADRERGLNVDVAELDALREKHGSAQVPEGHAAAPSADAAALIVNAQSSQRSDVPPQRSVVTAALGGEAQPSMPPLPQAAQAVDPSSDVEGALTVGALPPPSTRAGAAPSENQGGSSEPTHGAGDKSAQSEEDAVRAGNGNRKGGNKLAQRVAKGPKSRSKVSAVVVRDSELASATAPSRLPPTISSQYNETVIWGVGRNAHSAPRGGSANEAFARNFY